MPPVSVRMAARRGLLLALPLLVLLLLPTLAMTSARASVPAVEVGAGGDRYSGSGGLLLPGGSDAGTRREAAHCVDCRWRLSDPCSATGGPCLALTRGCAQLAYLLRVYLSTDSGRSLSDRGLVCIPPSGPLTVAALSGEVSRAFARIVPALDPSTQPRAGVVTQIPVNFISGHPPGLAPSEHRLLGQSIRLYPSVRWSWEFGDGARLQASSPGEPYPGGLVRHAYRQSGSRVVQVRADWTGHFEIDGLGPFPVSGGIRQEAALEVSVGEGRAVLVP